MKVFAYEICVCNCCGKRFWYTVEELCIVCYASMCPDCFREHDFVCCAGQNTKVGLVA